MNGRSEQEIKSEQKMKEKLLNYPQILSHFYVHMKNSGKSYTTIERYIYYLINFIDFFHGGRAVKEDFYKYVDTAAIKRYMSYIQKRDVNGKTVEVGGDILAVKWSALNTFFSFLKENELISDNPVDRTKRPKINANHSVTYLDKNEISAMLDKIKREAKPIFVNRDLCMISIGLATGLRVSSICNINIGDVDLDSQTITVIEAKQKRRIIHFGNNLKELLQSWMIDRETYFPNLETDALFISQMRRRISNDLIAVLVKRYTKGITKKKITPHTLRDSCAVAIYEQTNDLSLVSDILGTDRIDVVRKYARISDDGKKSTVTFLDDMI